MANSSALLGKHIRANKFHPICTLNAPPLFGAFTRNLILGPKNSGRLKGKRLFKIEPYKAEKLPDQRWTATLIRQYNLAQSRCRSRTADVCENAEC
mmetsp:Transcript_32994/g.129532  ORF Transcript_32994/g.129532 Transcript_32994/m.129532 type:complete len:96 (+) Transcript_32994:102-389(+)